jgi:hypothetical protein
VIGGEVFCAQVLEALGGVDNPMSPQVMRRKLEDCLTFGGFDAGRADFFEQGIARLETSTDVAADIRSLISGVVNR